jgi:hypothetical protein
MAQDDVKIHGHALELRVYAEDPLNNFMPSIGTLSTYKKPTGEGVRCDDGYEEGMQIPIYYDPMIAKLIVHAPTRIEAIQKMIEAIQAYQIEGVATTLPFGTFVMEHDAFVSGMFDTHFVQHHYTPEKIREKQRANAEIAALAALIGSYVPATGTKAAGQVLQLADDLTAEWVDLPSSAAENPGVAVVALGAWSDTADGAAPGGEAALAGTWEAGGDNGLVQYIETRQRYYNAGAKKWYAYGRKMIFDKYGRLFHVTAEIRWVVESPEVPA